MKTKKFYDIHFHAMDLSHANVTAFINRFLQEGIIGLFRKKPDTCRGWLRILRNVVLIILVALFIVPILLVLLIIFLWPNSQLGRFFSSILKKFIKLDNLISKKNNSLNLLSFMESAIEYDFLVLEEFLKEKDPVLDKKDGSLTIGNAKFGKIVLCPLVMDFGYNNINNPHIFYNIPPKKPVTVQTSDLFRAIWTYYTHTLTIKRTNTQNDIPDGPPKKFSIAKTSTPKEQRLFEIYPFMGLNTKNYSQKDTKAMLMKYFGDFSKDDSREKRQEMLFEKMGAFDGNLDHPDEQAFRNIFAGIKLYPPLGFEPWPEKEKELEKVKILYQTCVNRNIPVITHCSTEGFLVNNKYREYSDPSGQWAEVLEHYPQLKINFAHFGAGSKKWQDAIVKLIRNGAQHVYADFSCNTIKDKYYKKLAKRLSDEGGNLLEKRILFGTDFMIHLLWLESYNEYLHDFIRTKHLKEETKVRFAGENTERFLFGEVKPKSVSLE